LLVVHRQVQQLQRRFDFNPSARWWTAVSWSVTIACVSIGWIFFRANSLAEAGRMLPMLLAPASYASHFLSGSLYILVGLLALGYAAVLLVVQALDASLLEAGTPESNERSGFAALAARWRWYWVPPLYTVTLLFLLMVTLMRGADTAQFMYGNF
jgi:hypothetical protein